MPPALHHLRQPRLWGIACTRRGRVLDVSLPASPPAGASGGGGNGGKPSFSRAAASACRKALPQSRGASKVCARCVGSLRGLGVVRAPAGTPPARRATRRRPASTQSRPPAAAVAGLTPAARSKGGSGTDPTRRWRLRLLRLRRPLRRREAQLESGVPVHGKLFMGRHALFVCGSSRAVLRIRCLRRTARRRCASGQCDTAAADAAAAASECR